MKTEQVWLVDLFYESDPKVTKQSLTNKYSMYFVVLRSSLLKGNDYADKQIHSYLHCSILESCFTVDVSPSTTASIKSYNMSVTCQWHSTVSVFMAFWCWLITTPSSSSRILGPFIGGKKTSYVRRVLNKRRTILYKRHISFEI